MSFLVAYHVFGEYRWVVLHEALTELYGKPEGLLEVGAVVQRVLGYFYLDIRRSVVVASFGAISAAPAADVPGEQLSRPDISVFILPYDCVRADIAVRAVEVVLVWIHAAYLRRIHVAFQVRIVRAGGVDYDSYWASLRHGARGLECSAAAGVGFKSYRHRRLRFPCRCRQGLLR